MRAELAGGESPFFVWWHFCLPQRATRKSRELGSIEGTITDATGALIPNASVTLTEDFDPGEAHNQERFERRPYAFPNIRVGTYSLTVTAPGFGTYTSTGNVSKSAAVSR